MSLDMLCDPPPIDRTRAGVLSVNLLCIGNLLRLPEGQQVSAAVVDPISDTLKFMIEGAGLPQRAEGEMPVPVNLVLTSQVDDAAPDGPKYRTTAHWEHDPAQTWVVRDWSQQ
jgi:hypothetical protein